MVIVNDDDAALRRPRRPRRRLLSSLIGLGIVAALAAGGSWVALHPQPLIDQVTVWQYEPDAVIASHVERLQLTDHGRFLYYASRPTVSSGEQFSSDCPKDEDEQAFGILGCYLHADKTIVVFDVVDERLDGTEEVVAAHEMLHAAWDRMDDDEKDRLAVLLDAEYERLTNDPRFAERMAFYARNEPGQRANELHSIVGTEATGISAELEEHYAQYFEDRSVVTDLHSASNAVFVQLQQQADSLVSQMETLRTTTESDYKAYTSGYEQLNSDIATFNKRAESGFFTSPSAFDRARSRLIERGIELDEMFDSITARAAEYGRLASELESINTTSAELQRGLNIGGEVQQKSDTAG
ncbi:hypothetical protein DF220_12830 [Salinibacterium hongtaonis]|uniref:Uncharacterized protein n=1 Tax=Homoserinimonas hongtaonis TaxID=2079791 RepID=A0A2U1SX76_9MICO|nr:hypothetical protein DF220_12830 [Salinibacterium hongtaonis]